jgi:hypothetical protein
VLRSATGTNGEDWSSLLNFGANFIDLPGRTAMWSFAGSANYAARSGTVNIIIAKAMLSLSKLSSPLITVGTVSMSLSAAFDLNDA